MLANAVGAGDPAMTVAGRFRLGAPLVVRASAAVVPARDTDGTACVLKLAPLAAPSSTLGKEFRHLRALTHPSIVRTIEVGVVDDRRPLVLQGAAGPVDVSGWGFLALQRVEGTHPADWVDAAAPGGAVAAERLWRMACQLADALAYLHGRQLVHGDVTPANVIVDCNGNAILLDFGLSWQGAEAHVAGRGGQGTAGFAAPEALIGRISTRSDLFGLGASLYAAWARQPPYGDGAPGVVRMLSGQAPVPLCHQRAGLPPAFESVLMELLSSSAADRPAKARDLLRMLFRVGAHAGWSSAVAGAPSVSGEAGVDVGSDGSAVLRAALADDHDGGDALAGVFVGRRSELAALDEALSSLHDAKCPYAAIVVRGPPGAGRRTLLQEAVARAQLRALSSGAGTAGQVVPLSSLLSVAAEATSGTEGPLGVDRDPTRVRSALWAEALEEAASRALHAAQIVVSYDEDQVDPASLSVLAGQPAGRCIFLLVSSGPPEVVSPAVLDLPLSPLGAQDVASLLSAGGLDPEQAAERAERLIRLTGGHAGLVSMHARALLAGRPLLDTGQSAPAEMLRVSFREMPLGAQQAVLAAWWDVERDGADAASGEAIARGWLTVGAAGRVAVAAGWARQALWGAVPAADPAHAALAATAAAQLPPRDERRAEALRIKGEPSGAFFAFLDAAHAHATRGAWEMALWCWERAEEVAPCNVEWPASHVIWRAQGLGAMGKYRCAQEWLAAQPDPHDAAVKIDHAKVAAWLLRRQGRLGDAAAALQRAEEEVASLAPGAAGTEALRALRARLLVSQGRHSEAFALSSRIATDAHDTQLVAAEATALAAAYLGRPTDAHAALSRLRALHSSAPADSAARACAVEGLICQLESRTADAERAYAQAIELYEQGGDVHGRANAQLNRAMVLAEQGKFAQSLQSFSSAYQTLLRVGAFGDATAAAFNAGLLFVRLGDAEAAGAAESQLRHAAAQLGAPASAAWIDTLAAERAWQRGAWHEAHADFVRAADSFGAAGDPIRAVLSRASAAEAASLAGDVHAARAALQSAGDAHPAVAVPLAWARARLALAVRDNGLSSMLAGELAAFCDSDAAAGRHPAAFRSAVLAARLLEQAGAIPKAAGMRARAQQHHQEILVNTPREHRDAVAKDPDALWLARSAPAAHGGDGRSLLDLAQKLSAAEARLRRFVRLSKRLNSELRLPRLLETVLDTVIDLTEAERGFLLLRDAQGELAVRAARNIDETSLEGEGLAFSRSIAAQVARTGSPIVTVDAAADDRFAQALSVSDLQLRSVVAVPLTVKGQVEGTIYVDNRLRQGAFTDDDVATLLEFAELAALAIGNARLVTELRRRDRQIETLNRRLQSELAARKDELSSMRVQLSESRETFALRFDYSHIIGRSPRMMELLRLLDRISETNLPVVIQGESGSGKELVARALVANGARKDKPFVSENCAAIPETLLESTLFGYMRGAFTGADRDTQGLFAVAHQGTLFLDEVGEMSAALQGKLLRVLQEGEYRRVGGQRIERTDVRLIVATNKDLEAMVKQGRFRQDLFFRLAVVRVHLPPLRERREDIPLLVRHFLDVWRSKANVKAQSISPEALARLTAYPWPGNVRELENEIGRAAVFADTTIDVADLSPHVARWGMGAGSVDTSLGSPHSVDDAALESASDLTLKPQVERLERRLLRAALDRCGGNQSRAAEALGLSRFGLQKKLRRYDIDR